MQVPASECLRISSEFLSEELRELGRQRFSEDYELAWLEPDDAVSFPKIISGRIGDAVQPRSEWR
jgi:hypothetical protein